MHNVHRDVVTAHLRIHDGRDGEAQELAGVGVETPHFLTQHAEERPIVGGRTQAIGRARLQRAIELTGEERRYQKAMLRVEWTLHHVHYHAGLRGAVAVIEQATEIVSLNGIPRSGHEVTRRSDLICSPRCHLDQDGWQGVGHTLHFKDQHMPLEILATKLTPGQRGGGDYARIGVMVDVQDAVVGQLGKIFAIGVGGLQIFRRQRAGAGRNAGAGLVAVQLNDVVAMRARAQIGAALVAAEGHARILEQAAVEFGIAPKTEFDHRRHQFDGIDVSGAIHQSGFGFLATRRAYHQHLGSTVALQEMRHQHAAMPEILEHRLRAVVEAGTQGGEIAVKGVDVTALITAIVGDVLALHRAGHVDDIDLRDRVPATELNPAVLARLAHAALVQVVGEIKIGRGMDNWRGDDGQRRPHQHQAQTPASGEQGRREQVHGRRHHQQTTGAKRRQQRDQHHATQRRTG